MGTPNFPSYTSGHATFSSAAATVLSHIFPEESATLEGWAQEASESRFYAGIHYKFDAEAGVEQGRNVASYAVEVLRVDGGE